MTIYISAIHRADSFRPMLLRQPNVTWFLTAFAEAVSYEPANATTKSALNLFTWEITVLIAIFIGAAAIFSKRRLAGDPFRKDVVIYHWTVLAAGLVGYFWFLWRLSYVMQPWYYLALMALLAVCSDGLIGSVRRALPAPSLSVSGCIRVRLWFSPARYGPTPDSEKPPSTPTRLNCGDSPK